VVARADLVEVQTNGFNTCFSTREESLYCFGYNEWGELGLSDQLPRSEPALVSGASSVAAFAVSWQHTCFRAADATVRCSGRGLEGQMGDGSTDIALEFRDVALP
jgi:alpha-tubulin suppressor-like RCC1 family protein